MQKPKKITIKHYLNKNLKSNENGYRVYVRITFDRVNQKQTSKITQRFNDLETLHKVAHKEIEIEKRRIENFIKKQLLVNENFSFKVPKSEVIKRKKSIIRSLENALKNHKKQLLELEQYDLFKPTI
ncbi:hypothetical protein [Flavobacterium branchiophilum]|uniref:Uncharacterized protein n=1 Tax=Flavobacterium branchiophilum TaxID=55197 RepID=A0A2H3KAE6_9FLAO|nr:hypothetical protein [Flavobacterium branchiophilum]PDS23555.1 hypothetical protein B0A77_10645 [Flavobacterium branchiophilum]